MELTAPRYRTEAAARRYLEAQFWPDGPVCPHCGRHGDAAKMNREAGTGTHGRNGLYQCRGCRKQFTVTVGTIFEGSKIPLDKWLLAVHLMCAAKKGISALQLQRELKLGSYRSAWFLCRRIRWAMKKTGRIVEALLRVEPAADMPRPGAHRQKSVWAEVNEEISSLTGTRGFSRVSSDRTKRG